MTNKMVFVGYITGVFGIKGEVKCSLQTNHLEDILQLGHYLYINDAQYTINSIKKNNNHYILGFKEISDISQVDNILKKELFINRDEYINIDYFTSELFNLEIIDESNKKVGTIKEVLYNKNNLFVKDGQLIIPVIDKYVKKIDINKGVLIVSDVGELRL